MTDTSDFYRRVETECPAFQARVAARALTRYYNACFRPLGITAEQFSLLVGIGGSHEPTLAELAARAGVDATTLSRSVKSLERNNLVHSHGGRGRAGKRLALTDKGLQLMAKSMATWEDARVRLAEALGEETSHVAGSVMSQLAVAAQTATSAAGFGVAE
ncbi:MULTISPECIES: MarR family winged helix-turn-helix transcriptional regulator [Rhizobium/Agrobacterium group]|uniref:Transcriptional regulator protein n=2 Tax=Rhizobium/Agrobacterium group TaxID=227290 RepID=B9JTH7_ALLAM|nr:MULTISPECIES: MarR family winged helix-turn-helix transcriptional regulator [Rhizobium/Agrobacterium group]ACM37885.1 transcriptional regulator protein [Allorhizobium ampelinum S4]MCF1446679.1 winged helix-turn-helix transcriptional regulator [Allorhizobium ampelinum]MCF1491565.1 winged helix-turn-helix transcriptional regulator [Allorhizobium ampelinum]MUO29051.1 winged helix DNA-binding protein [Agrobacterium vitis]MUO43417.1 winged helix DNA-binding protein [Agrobacterium vitis]